MRKLFPVILMLVLMACSKPLNEPKNLIPKDKMAEMIADFAINDQMGILNQSGNMETNSIYILKKYNTDSKGFNESYKYYLASPSDLEDIFNDAQDIIMKKDPAAEDYINKKLKDNKGVPAFAR